MYSPAGLQRPSQKKADLLLTGLHTSKKTPLDLGFTHSTVDTYLNNKSMSERAAAANAYVRRAHPGGWQGGRAGLRLLHRRHLRRLRHVNVGGHHQGHGSSSASPRPR
jgi:hypothetical protein